MQLTGESKFFLAIIGATIAVIAGAFMLLSRPAPTVSRQQLLPAGTYTKGNPNAITYLVEFSDFQCPACKAAKPVVDALVEKYKDKLVFGYRHFPLPQHQFAKPAALAAESAGIGGKFWEAYDLLFANQDNLSNEFLSSKFSQIDSTLLPKIEKDLADGTSFGVNATPTFFLNGVKLTLASFDDLQKEVDKAVQ